MNLDKLTTENYQCPKGEELSYHCVIENVNYDKRTGAKLSVPRLQKFGRKTFENGVYDNLLKQGYSVKILHNPNEWLKAKKAIIEKAAAEKEAAAKEAEAQKMQAAIDAAVEKRLAEMQVKVEQKSKKAKPAAEKSGE